MFKILENNIDNNLTDMMEYLQKWSIDVKKKKENLSKWKS